MLYPKEPHPLKNIQPVIHRAPWIVTGSSDAITGQGIVADGALVVAEGRIKAVGPYREILKDFVGYQIREHENRFLASPLINSHCHLELSYLDLAGKDGDRGSYGGNPTVWIRHLLQEKARFYEKNGSAEEAIFTEARQILQHMHSEGVGFIGDIGNSLESREIGHEQKTVVFFLLELLGLTEESEARTFARLDEMLGDDASAIACTAHAPYSTTPDLIRKLKKKADLNQQIFSIHTAESIQEVEFLQTGYGEFRDFLEERGAWDGSFEIPGKSSIQYLESLGALNTRTICVHAVHVSSGEIETLARTGAKVCLCPGSNRFLGVGKAPVTEFLDHGILPALGTDSKASNPVLSMWREMRLLREDHPGLEPEMVFAMATRGGAEAWGISEEVGTLEPGKGAHVLAVDFSEPITTDEEVFDFLTSVGESVQVEWLG